MLNSDRLDDTLIALADPTRRAILDRLSRGQARVTEVAQPLPISLNSVSKHIRILERAGLVRRRQVGRDHFLSIDPRRLKEITDWMQSRQSLWSQRLDRLARLLDVES
jgi:DNA-binding transcriptional ArsR family regulator